MVQGGKGTQEEASGHRHLGGDTDRLPSKLAYLCIDNKSNTYVWLDHMYLLSGFMLFMHR